MADQLHYSIRDFRDTLLSELTKLEFGAREHLVNNIAVTQTRSVNRTDVDMHMIEHEREVKKLRKENNELAETIRELEAKSKNSTIVDTLESEVEILNRQLKKLQQQMNSDENNYKKLQELYADAKETNKIILSDFERHNRRINELEELVEKLEGEKEELIVKQLTEVVRKEDTLNKVIALVKPETKPVIEKEVVEEEAVELNPESLPDFKHKGKIYKRDTDNSLYIETEEGWENVGTWDTKTNSIIELTEEVAEEEVAEEEVAEEVAEEEEEVEEDSGLTEFTYKGKTYHLDGENNVYQETDEGYEEVGKWNGKKILFE